MKKKYRVYISQVNQTYYDVDSNGITSAKSKACRLWKSENSANVISVKQLED
jgi:hypothetical protein